MILLCGIETEEPLAMVRCELEAMGAPYLMLDQRRVRESRVELELSGTRVEGALAIGSEATSLERFHAIYARLMDDTLLPEVTIEPPTSEPRRRCRLFHDLLVQWFEIAPALVLNRASAMASNQSKPYQSQVIRTHGFCVPETLITNDPEAVLSFRNEHGKLVYKSISGVRSIVRVLDSDGERRLAAIRWCPVQFQEFVEGLDVRVHVVGEEVFATEIRTNAPDYRYAHREADGRVELRPTTLAPDLASRCVGLSAALGLPLAGLDLKLRPDGRVYCFEVNPSPGFSFFERASGQPIAASIARYLAEA